MAYVAPNSTISVLKGVPFDNTYEHTILFASTLDQQQYFANLALYTFDRQSYQRVNRDYIRVGKSADELMGCNYLMFQNTFVQNTNHGSNKWFYAFITEVNYINENVSEIKYEIDDIQTWHFDYDLERCFVEREHSATDVAGDNTVPEDLELGEYVSCGLSGTGKFSEYNIVMCTTFDSAMQPAGGTMRSGVYSGLYYSWRPLTPTGASQMSNDLTSIANAGKSDGVVAIFLHPTAFCTAPDEGSGLHLPPAYAVTKAKPAYLGELNTPYYYLPKNKKLLTYPYNMLYVTNYQGNSAVFHYELFSTSDCQFSVTGDFCPNSSFALYPHSYKGIGTNFDEQITMSGTPQVAYITDVYKNWLARTASSLPFDMIANATGLVAGIYRSNAIATALQTTKSAALVTAQRGTAVLGAISYVSRMLGGMAEHRIKPPQANGEQSSYLMVANKQFDFHLMQRHIKPEFARIIDNYFTAYGYACHRLKVPNRDSRPHWNFCKTNGCAIKSKSNHSAPVGLPAEASAHICQIYDKGITWWKNGSTIGDYTVDNSPI